ncbi:Cilia- and flagella-associated protein 52 (WD repeat-containing protein 16) [Durusdinium trenchii]|uniref:Cilia- and flagella-associated protein 52 (WD repeat-containing protein 16) n=1 Tax=Durusdinium trenchii TaxID=1381693 RepID=A0ABP0S9L8_9DINO
MGECMEQKHAVALQQRRNLQKSLWELQCDGPAWASGSQTQCLFCSCTADAIVTCTAQQLAVWDAKSHERQRGVRGKGFWQALTYASHSQSAIMGGRDGTVVVWDICTGEAKQELCAALSIALTGCGSAISSLDYAESLKAVFSGEENGTVILWDLCRGLQLSVVWCDAAVNCLAYWFIAPYIRDIPHLHNGEMMQKLIPATPRGTMGRTFLTGDTAFKVKVWDIETGIAKKVFHCHSHVLVLAVSPFLGLIAAGEANGRVTLWDAEVESLGEYRINAARVLGHRHGQKNIQCANQEGAESPDVLLVGDSAGLVRALRLEDPEKRVRLFSEHWSRVSSKTISNPQRVEVVRLPGSHGCGNISRPLPVFPAGLLQMRELLPKLFSGHCDMGEVQDWAHKTNFILIDLSIGQALLVGTGVELVTPDSSLGSFKDDGSNEAAPALQGSDYLLQAQRLSRWLRKLPNTHRGWIVVADEALSLWQQRFVRSGRRYPLLSPACISRVTAHGGHKFRVTPGTKWCGDAGWSHVDFFPVLRSGTNIPAEKRVPICISFNKVGYYYRFENSVRGCMGKHRPTGTHWTHAHTIYTSRDATGQAYCVGMKEDREHTRWTMQKGDICSSDGFKHSFGFRAMRNDYTSPLAPCCILVALQFELGSKETPLQRFAAGKECESSSEWRVVYKLVLWSKPIGAEHHRMCLAAGSSEKVAEDGSAARDPHEVFRVFYDSACEKKSLVTFEGERKFYWTISTENLFLPETATGVHLCLCHVVLSKLASPQESVKKKDMPFYTWVESKCPRGAKKELCFNTLGPSDVLNAVHLVDEIV